jgi:oligosaccharide repeat unit polymerase
MHVFWHFLVVIVCAWQCVTCLPQLQARIAKLLVFAGFGIIHGIVPIFTPSHMTYGGGLLTSDLHWAGFVAFTGVICFAIGWQFVERTWRPTEGISQGLGAWIASEEGQAVLRRMFVVCAIAGFVLWYTSVAVAAGSLTGAFRAGRFQHRFEGGALSIITSYGQALMFVPGFVGFFLSRRYRWAGIAYAVAMAGIVFFATQGARATPLGLLGALLLAYALTHRIYPVQLAKLTVALLCLAFLGSGLYEVRKIMSRASFSEIAEVLVSRNTYQGMLTRDPLNYHQMLVAAVHHFPANHPYLNGATYRRLAFFYVPTQYAGGLKPNDTNMLFAQVIGGIQHAERLTTIPPSVPGDAYINFWGVPGVVVILFLYGAACAVVLNLMDRNLIWFVAIGAGFVRLLTLGLRGQPYENILVIGSAIVMVWLVARLCGWNSGRSQLVIYGVNSGQLPLTPPSAAMPGLAR